MAKMVKGDVLEHRGVYYKVLDIIENKYRLCANRHEEIFPLVKGIDEAIRDGTYKVIKNKWDNLVKRMIDGTTVKG